MLELAPGAVDVAPVAEVVARGSTYEQWVTARLDPDEALRSLTPGSSVRQSFDHLADRNLDLIKRHLDTLAAPGATRFAYRRADEPKPQAASDVAPDEGNA